MKKKDLTILRNLAKRYINICRHPVMNERRFLWTKKNSLKLIEPLILVNFGMHNFWCREIFGDHKLECENEFFRMHERQLRMHLFHYEIGDDWITEPYLTVRAVFTQDGCGDLWGLPTIIHRSSEKGGAGKFEPVIKNWNMLDLLSAPQHKIDEEKTIKKFNLLNDAIGDIIPVGIDRSPVCLGFAMDISTYLGRLRGHQQITLDMYDSPEQLHKLLFFMRDGILANQKQAEDAGDITLLSHVNQAMQYCEELEPPRINSGPRTRKQIWGYCAAQEYTLISPSMHNEFLLQYQLPILYYSIFLTTKKFF